MYASISAAVRSKKRTRVSQEKVRCRSPCTRLTPVNTLCHRPLRRASICRASASSAGLPRIVPSTATTVSAPITICVPLFRGSALRRDSCSTAAAGAIPAGRLSSTSVPCTVKSRVICASSSRRRGELEAKIIITHLVDTDLGCRENRVFARQRTDPAPAVPAADFQQKNKNVHRRCAFLAYGRPYKAVRR